ncbi:phosphate signaling complex protein PhoU [Entomobacter blattae]|uniref:Phosphate-specific transport system accessory protein PhoU n=1 Tax=Entomobacter blattae TaxID=2762277 RepID=A0A7H1NNW2_9PROT|nr:phosphate signaling complex protein PhoU [Entomobacter blattae]QNT77472.1 Phosphate-specific transport system accessory protein PhoU [Entomobacter blattae]
MTSQKHTVHSYEKELSYLKELLLRMSGLVEQQFSNAINLLLQGQNTALAQNIIRADQKTDSLEKEIEINAIKLLALRAPMAQDLREIVSSLKISANLERIGDLAANIARRFTEIGDINTLPPLSSLITMGKRIEDNLQKTIQALTQLDKDMVFYLWAADEQIDQFYINVLCEITNYMTEHKEYVTPCSHLLFIAKNMERIGDHITNISEYVYYIVTGDLLPSNIRSEKNSPAYKNT